MNHKKPGGKKFPPRPFRGSYSLFSMFLHVFFLSKDRRCINDDGIAANTRMSE